MIVLSTDVIAMIHCQQWTTFKNGGSVQLVLSAPLIKDTIAWQDIHLGKRSVRGRRDGAAVLLPQGDDEDDLGSRGAGKRSFSGSQSIQTTGCSVDTHLASGR